SYPPLLPDSDRAGRGPGGAACSGCPDTVPDPGPQQPAGVLARHVRDLRYPNTHVLLVYYLYRSYEPKLQRWPNTDPITEKGGLNLNGMLSNDAINRFDKFGHGNYVPKDLADAAASGDCSKDPQVFPYEAQKRHFPDDPDPYGGAYRHCV